MLSQDEFYDRAKDFALLKDVDGKYFTLEEYHNLIKDSQTDKDGQLVYLYATNSDEQYTYIEAAREKGYSVLLMDGDLDTPLISRLEQKLEKCRFMRVDGDIVDRLIQKEDAPKNELNADETDRLSEAFRSQMPKLDKAEFYVEIQSLGNEAAPVVITQSEYMRRMKDISRFQSGMNFYAQMPDTFNFVLNADHRLIKTVLDEVSTSCSDSLKPVDSEIKGLEARLAALRQEQGKKKPEEITDDEKKDVADTEKAVQEQRDKKKQIICDAVKDNSTIHQLIDIALLQNGMLKGAALNKFIKRSIELI